MSERGDLSDDMTRADTTLLDDDTAERLLRGLPVDTAPSSVRALGDVLRALRDRTPAIDPAGERAGVAAFLAGLAQDEEVETAVVAPLAAPVVSLAARRQTRPRHLRFAAAAAVAGLTLLSGMAAVGALPGAAQTVAHDMLGTVGISVPEPASATDGHADTRGTDAGAGTNAPAPAPANGPAGAATTPVGSTATGGSGERQRRRNLGHCERRQEPGRRARAERGRRAGRHAESRWQPDRG
jgi:hypothetical protein